MEEQHESTFNFGEATRTIEGSKEVNDDRIVENIDIGRISHDAKPKCVGATYGDVGEPIEFNFTTDIEEAQNQLQKWLSGGDWDRKKLLVSELDGDHCCPNCDREFHQPSWKPLDGFNHHGSIQWEYGCPTETCDTLIVVRNDVGDN